MQKPIMLEISPNFSFIKKYDKEHGTKYQEYVKALINQGLKPVITGPSELDIHKAEDYIFKISCDNLPELPGQKEYVATVTCSNCSVMATLLGFMRNKTIQKHIMKGLEIQATN